MDAWKPELLNLPWATLLTLASGYAGYYIANVGVREHHRPIDVTFSALVFGFFAAFAYAGWRELGGDILRSSAVAFATAIVLGGFWSLKGRRWLDSALRYSEVAHTDDLPSAWIALFRQPAYGKQLSVKLKDGTWLMCESLDTFAKALNGPCILGGKGDVLLYVTHIKSPGDTEFTRYEHVRLPEWGDEITYIPADQIARLDYRRTARTVTSYSGPAAAMKQDHS